MFLNVYVDAISLFFGSSILSQRMKLSGFIVTAIVVRIDCVVGVLGQLVSLHGAGVCDGRRNVLTS